MNVNTKSLKECFEYIVDNSKLLSAPQRGSIEKLGIQDKMKQLVEELGVEEAKKKILVSEKKAGFFKRGESKFVVKISGDKVELTRTEAQKFAAQTLHIKNLMSTVTKIMENENFDDWFSIENRTDTTLLKLKTRFFYDRRTINIVSDLSSHSPRDIQNKIYDFLRESLEGKYHLTLCVPAEREEEWVTILKEPKHPGRGRGDPMDAITDITNDFARIDGFKTEYTE